ncbi:unnamed protein product [Lathyrus oleraceus]|uniref:Uncharacterized protein n=1 Tax=Pisum sativum TaxID=3888 RepID=A0A9D4VSQ6_PEA|nr:uncharacterized protein LOC127103954 [Pisum sativum]KAI5389593.1 hypothetical protein KIW84_075038 [Pisum sativum]
MSKYSQGSNCSKSHFISDECRCSLDAPLMTLWTDANPICRLYGRGMYKLQGHKRCNHFVWYDEEMTPRSKELISSFHERLGLEKIKVNECKHKEDELKKEIKFLKIQLKFTIGFMIVLLIGLVATSVLN